MPSAIAGPVRTLALRCALRWCAALVALLAMAATPVSAQQKLRVVTTFSILADLVRNVGGDDVVVINLVGPNSDAHVYDPTPADAKAVRGADLVIVNGLRFEGWLDRLIAASGYRGAIVTASSGVSPRVIGGEPDPHAWQRIDNARVYVRNIQRALTQHAPRRAAAIDARAQRYLQTLAQLEREVATKLARIAPQHRRAITSHDAFGYFSIAYGIEFLSPHGWSTDTEASAQDVARIVRQIKAQGARALFVENITDPRLIERIRSEAGGVLGGTLYSDALSPPGSEADSYVKMFRHNVDAMVRAMQVSQRAAQQ